MIFTLLSNLLAGKYEEASQVFAILANSIYSGLITSNAVLILLFLIRPFPWLRRFNYRKRCITALVIALASVFMSTMLYISYLGIVRFSQDIFERCQIFDYQRNLATPPLEDPKYRIVFSCDSDGRHEKSYIDGTHAMFYDLHYLDKQIARDCQIVKQPSPEAMIPYGEYQCGSNMIIRQTLNP